MPSRVAELCAHHQAVEALTHDALPDEQRPQVLRHLEQCDACRAFFRKKTTGWFPALENYTVVEKVDEGGFGVVYKAIHHAKQRTEALKVLYGRTPLRAAYFENEVHLVARLRHPNIATLHDAQLKKPPLYYTMEYVEGERLDHYLKAQTVSLPERIRIIKTVAEAIGYAHGQGVAHRDIKPQNILIDPDGQPRIVDFGIAKKLELAHKEETVEPLESPQEEGAIGTLGYIAPEQTAGKTIDARADVFALGALLFHCVTGEPARWAKDTILLRHKLRERGISRADDLAAIIDHAVEPNPERRYPTCAAFVNDLEHYLEGRVVRAHEHRSLGSVVARVTAFQLLHHPYAVRTALAVGIVVLLTAIFWRLGAGWTAPGTADGRTVLIGFGPRTLQLLREGTIGSDLPRPGFFNRRRWQKSWRVLHGRLMEKLAAAKPSVVVWDYYFPDAQPEFDDDFVRGVAAVGAPVVVACDDFDINGEPLMSAQVRDAVHSYGAIVSTPPGLRSNEFDLVACLQRGFERPIPSLTVAAFAAARFPDCRLDLQLEPAELQLRYSRLKTEPGRARYRDETDVITIDRIHTVDKPFPGLQPGDRVAHFRVPKQPLASWTQRTIAYEDVLTAQPEQIRRWFDGRAVMVGQMLPEVDEYDVGDGERVFGCQVHAQALDALLTHLQVQPFSRGGLALRVCLWCAAAAVLAGLWYPGPKYSLRIVTAGSAAGCALGLALAVYAAAWIRDAAAVEFAIAGSALFATGSLALLANALRERQLRLAPETFVPAQEEPTLDSTVLAETS